VVLSGGERLEAALPGQKPLGPRAELRAGHSSSWLRGASGGGSAAALTPALASPGHRRHEDPGAGTNFAGAKTAARHLRRAPGSKHQSFTSPPNLPPRTRPKSGSGDIHPN
jgi:hypothetical protein